MSHPVGIVTYESAVHAWVLDLSGCLVGGADLSEATGKLPIVIAEYEGWLARYGQQIAPSDGWTIAETVAGEAVASDASGGEYCFASDLAPISRDEFALGVERMRFAHADLARAIDGQPDAILDWAPQRASVAAFDPWAPGVRTIRGIVQHVLQIEAYCRDGLIDGAAAGKFDAAGDIATEHARTIERLRSLTGDDASRVHRPQRPSRDTPDDWTARKMLRRAISHTRVHTADILQIQAWILVGAPGDAPW